MNFTKQELNSIDMVIVALRKGHFFNIEGEEVLALSSHVQRLIGLKNKIQKILSEEQPIIQQSSVVSVSEPRPIQNMELVNESVSK